MLTGVSLKQHQTFKHRHLGLWNDSQHGALIGCVLVIQGLGVLGWAGFTASQLAADQLPSCKAVAIPISEQTTEPHRGNTGMFNKMSTMSQQMFGAASRQHSLQNHNRCAAVAHRVIGAALMKNQRL